MTLLCLIPQCMISNLSVILLWVYLTFYSGCSGVRVFPTYLEINTSTKETVKLPCELRTTCPDKPQITWFKGKPGVGPIVLKVNTAGKEYINPNYTNRVRRDGEANLVIISPELWDTGNYSCEALITVDIPPIDAGYVFLNVSKLPDRTPSTTTKTDLVGLTLPLLDTIGIVSGILWLFLGGKSAFVGSGVSCVYTNLSWIGLCLVSATILWIHYSLLIVNIYRDSLRTVGIVLSVLAIILCTACHLHRLRMWIIKRKDGNRRSFGPFGLTSKATPAQSSCFIAGAEEQCLRKSTYLG